MLRSWLATAIAILIGDRLLDGVFLGGVVPALIAAAVLGLVNLTVKPILFLLTLPITLVTLGLFTFVLNAMMLGLVAWLLPSFAVSNLLTGIGLAIIVAIVNAVATRLFGKDKQA
ncbi:MAG: phage holin family protein [Alphaproteobacteria bacterium]|nr:phage holin family protein [Alphaproteobacteria bacterium]